MSHTADPDPNIEEDGDFWSFQRTADEWDTSVKTIRREVDRGALEVVRLSPSGRIVCTTRRTRAAYLAARRR